MKIHGMLYRRPIPLGEVIVFESRIVLTGKSRLVAYIELISKEEPVVSGFITFVHVDKETKPIPHGIVITPTRPEDIELQERAKQLTATD